MTRSPKPLPNDLPPRTVTDFTRSDRYRAEVHRKIPGGAHTYSKGDDQFPVLAPAAIVRGKHGRVWDVDGNEYVDCALGLGSVALGHAYEPVLAAVRETLELGVNFARPASIELDLANEFLAIAPGMERIKFARNGSTVTTAAVKLARAFTGRELIAFPANHAFYSYDDWFIGRGMVPSGVPEGMKAFSVTYNSMQPDTLAALFKQHPGKIAAVITEPLEGVPTTAEALTEIVRIARADGALVIFDEMVSGFRAGFPGAYQDLGLVPDLATWGKAAGNGFSLCALTGRADVMDLGGIKQRGRPRVFLISSTHGGEAHSLAAGRAVIAEYKSRDVLGRHRALVSRVAAGFRRSIADNGLTGAIEIHASSWRALFTCRDAEGQVSWAYRTLLLQEMIGRGVLAQSGYVPCFTHTDEDIDQVLSAFESACQVYRLAIDRGVDEWLVGEPIRPVFRKYNGCLQSCPGATCPHEATCRERPSS